MLRRSFLKRCLSGAMAVAAAAYGVSLPKWEQDGAIRADQEPKWKNWSVQYVPADLKELVEKMKRAHEKMDWNAPAQPPLISLMRA